MKLITTIFLLSYLSILNAFALSQSEITNHKIIIKSQLESELRTTYLKKLENALGDCGRDAQSCLRLIDNSFYEANFKKAEICFPYTKCGFYKCMENKYKCSDVGVNYFTDLAYPTCNQYEENIDDGMFTEKGMRWIYTVMVCLQKGLVDDCQVKGNCPENIRSDLERKKVCDYITDFTLSYHPGCYINSGIGVCRLPLKDKLGIWKTVSPYLTPREREEAYKVVFNCIAPKSIKKTLQAVLKDVL